MEEIVLTNKQNGMRTLLLGILVELLSVAGIVVAAVLDTNGVSTPVWVTILVV